MKNKEIFFSPFRLISPRLDTVSSRLAQLFEVPPKEVTCLEEGLLMMMGKLLKLTGLIRKALIIPDSEKLKECDRLAKEIHDEEKGLTGDLVCNPSETTGDLLKTVVLFPGHLERVGDFLESILNVVRIKERQGVPFSDKAMAEIGELFDLFTEMLVNFRDVLLTRNRALLEKTLQQADRVGELSIEFLVSHEDRLLEGLCSPFASSLFLDILDSLKHAAIHVREMCEALLKITVTHESSP
ncbi:MAG: hypothetical protein WBG50_25310 [Desulfomonilaceae bacterium]